MTTTHDIYRNLNKARKEPAKHVWSIRTKGRVVDHSTDVVLTDVTFKVSESTRQRIIKANKRNVCAFVRGTLAKRLPAHLFEACDHGASSVRVSFNPYKSGSFYVCETGQQITHADAVVFTVNGAFAINPS